jgi:hypothetical protein
MESTRFDDVARSLAAPRTRRGVLAGLAGLLAAGLVGTRAVGAACLPGQVRRAGRLGVCKATGRPPVANPSCPSGQVACGGCCVPACAGQDILDSATCTCAAPPCPLNDCEPPDIRPAGGSSVPPIRRDFRVLDYGSGLASVVATAAVNVDVAVSAFAPGTPSIFVYVTKLDDAQPSAVALRATDLAGNSFDHPAVTF